MPKQDDGAGGKDSATTPSVVSSRDANTRDRDRASVPTETTTTTKHQRPRSPVGRDDNKKKNDHKNAAPPLYLYRGVSSHPVREYLYDEVEDGRLVGASERGGAVVLPGFLMDVTWSRVVQFYSPSSVLCRRFRPRFVEAAREILRAARRPGGRATSVVEFRAVSCDAHADLCRALGVRGVPEVRLFERGGTEGRTLPRTRDNGLDPTTVTRALGIDDAAVAAPENRSDGVDGGPRAPTTRADATRSLARGLELAVEGLRRRRDADDDGTTTTTAVLAALVDWTDLLRWTLPSSWGDAHDLVNDVRRTLEKTTTTTTTTDDDGRLVDVLDVVVRDRVASRGPPSTGVCDGRGAGYACGLWELLHVVTIGAVEQRRFVVGDAGPEATSTRRAASVLRDAVETLLLPTCGACRAYFRRLYDECAFDRCRRLADPDDDDDETETTEKNDDHRRRELALWLWEVHNDVNVKVLKEKLGRDGREAGRQDLIDVRWPSTDSCDSCWNDDGSWNKDKVYEHLHDVYWPKGVQNPRLVVLKRATRDSDAAPLGRHRHRRRRRLELLLSAVAVAAIALLAWFRVVGARRRRRRPSSRRSRAPTTARRFVARRAPAWFRPRGPRRATTTTTTSRRRRADEDGGGVSGRTSASALLSRSGRLRSRFASDVVI